MNTAEQTRRWVVSGVDGSEASSAAVRYAAGEARRLGAGLRLVHVVPMALPEVGARAFVPPDPAHLGRSMLADAVELAETVWPDIHIETRLVNGRRAEAIVAASSDAEEIVLGHGPFPGVLRLATGSTVIGVAGHAQVPVIAVAAATDSSAAGRATHGRIVAGVGSPRGCGPLLRHSFEVARERGVPLLVVHAWEMPTGYEGMISSEAEIADIEKQLSEPITEALEKLAAELPDVRYEFRVLHGNPAMELEALSRESDLLLISRRKHAFPQGHVGSTGRALLRHSGCPVMFLPLQEDKHAREGAGS